MSAPRGNRRLRFLDKYAGIPLVRILGILTRRRDFDPGKARRIGVMKTVAIGDTVLLSGVVADVRAAFPKATIVLITGEDNRAVAQMYRSAGDELLTTSPRRPWQAVRAIRAARLDVLLDFGAWPRFDAVLTALSGARLRVGFNTPGQSKHHAYDRTVPYMATGHELDNNRRLVTAVGVQSVSPPSIDPPGVLSPARTPQTPYIVFHPWPGGFMNEVKRWPAERWVALADRIRGRGWQVIVTGGPGNRDDNRELVDQLRAAGTDAVDAAGGFSVPELADLLAGSVAVVSVDTGVMHLAAAVGARTVSLHGPTASPRWGPIGPRVHPVNTQFEGCGYLNLGWEYAGHRLDCMQGIEVDAVVQALDSLTQPGR